MVTDLSSKGQQGKDQQGTDLSSNSKGQIGSVPSLRDNRKGWPRCPYTSMIYCSQEQRRNHSCITYEGQAARISHCLHVSSVQSSPGAQREQSEGTWTIHDPELLVATEPSFVVHVTAPPQGIAGQLHASDARAPACTGYRHTKLVSFSRQFQRPLS